MPRQPPSASDGPINDEDMQKLVRRSNEDACNELLARLIKHHPEHERPIHRSSSDDDPVRKRERD